MTKPVRIALKIGALLSLLVAIFVVTAVLVVLNQREYRAVAGLMIVAPAWIAVASAVVAIPVIFIRAGWAARLTCLSAIAALPLGLAFSFSRLFCVFANCGEWETEHVVQPDGLIMVGPFLIALLCQRLSIRK